MYDDVPVYFWLVGGGAGLLRRMGWPLDDATLLSSRVHDCFAPPLAAVPIIALGHAWSAGGR
jgi:hypothetical protein